MKVLWLCNMVLPDFCNQFGFKKNVFGGWLSGMLMELGKINNIDIGLIFPIIDKKYLKNGTLNKCKYYSIHSEMNSYQYIDYSDKMVDEFECILKDFNPDIIHIWGTEYPHSGAMLEACEKNGLVENVVINIQGLISICAMHYNTCITDEYKKIKTKSYKSIDEERNLFTERGKVEVETLKKSKHVIGRTEWDKACTTLINSKIKYHFCNEILREKFYENYGQWSLERCEKKSIFISQASYPLKGLHIALDALRIVADEFPDVHLYIAGNDITSLDKNNEIKPYGQYIKMLIEKFNLKNKVTFTGILNEDEMCKQYLNSNLFLSPSLIENSPNSIGEAMMLGVPIISSNVGGVNNFIEHRASGLLYQFDASYMLASYIKEIFEDENLVNDLSKNTKIKAKKIFDREKNVNETLRIYNKIIKKKV